VDEVDAWGRIVTSRYGGRRRPSMRKGGWIYAETIQKCVNEMCQEAFIVVHTLVKSKLQSQ
jgi:hypothetical protein